MHSESPVIEMCMASSRLAHKYVVLLLEIWTRRVGRASQRVHAGLIELWVDGGVVEQCRWGCGRGSLLWLSFIVTLKNGGCELTETSIVERSHLSMVLGLGLLILTCNH